MGPEGYVDIIRRTFGVVSLLVSAAILPSLVVGLMVSVFQATTSINEQTLSFLPRLRNAPRSRSRSQLGPADPDGLLLRDHQGNPGGYWIVSLPFEYLSALIASYFWPFVRLSSMMMVMVVFGTRMMPTFVRLVFSVAVTAAIVPLLPCRSSRLRS